ncbi:MAG: sulfatase [Fuerstiella sp.]|nr:sulfatase [Fuerstiella sp.]
MKSKRPSRRTAFVLVILLSTLNSGLSATAKSLNVLFIPVDDLNHWVGYTGRNPQCKTPNIDRLAAMGVSFTNAHCAAPACGPSRAALWSGIRPHSSGCYVNGDPWKRHIKEGLNLNAHFRKNGYYTAAMGKTYHSSASGMKSVYASEWDEYPPTTRENSAGRAPTKFEGYHEPLPLDLHDKDLPDWHTVDFCIDRMNQERDKPFFIACGLIKPHLPWAVPRKYYEMYPRENVRLPPHRNDDLDDLPKAGVRMAGPEKDHAKFLKSGRWKDAVQSYLATIAYVDMNVGRLLDAYEASPQRDNTIIVFWGDHGWHLGEKQHWRKFALWEEATRTPFIWVAPGVTKPGTICDRPVDFMSIYPTLCELATLKPPEHLEGKSIVPLLENPKSSWDGVALTTHGYLNHAIRDGRYRYIRYADGTEELYDHKNDSYEFTNLAGSTDMVAVKEELAAHLPKINKKPTKTTPTKKNRKE